MRTYSLVLRTKLILIAMLLCACEPLINRFQYDAFKCGKDVEDEERTSLYQFTFEHGAVVDLRFNSPHLIDKHQHDLPENAYRVSSKGCLILLGHDQVHMHIPGTGLFADNLGPTSELQVMPLRLDRTMPTVRLTEERSVFPGNASLSVVVDDRVRIRYCIERRWESICNPDNNLWSSFLSENFALPPEKAIPLPNDEGDYLIYIIAQNRPGNLRLVTKPIQIDLSTPHVAVSAIEDFDLIPYDDNLHYYVPSGFRLDFVSTSNPIASLRIDYCLKPADNETEFCSPENIYTYGHTNPKVLERGNWQLIYRAQNQAGQLSQAGWVRKRLLVKVECSDTFLFENSLVFLENGCTELIGNIDVGRLSEYNWFFVDRLVKVRGDIRLLFDDNTKKFPTFKNLRFLRNLDVSINFGLEELDAFPNLVEVGDSFAIFANRNLRVIRGVEKIRSIYQLSINGNSVLEKVDAFSSLDEISYYASISGNDLLPNLEFLSNLKNVKRDLVIFKNNSLTNLMGLRSLQSVQKFSLGNNANLETLSGLDSFKASEGSISITGQNKLKTIDAFGQLEFIGNISIANNPELESIRGFQKLMHIYGDLSIQNNTSLTSIEGFEFLEEIGGDIRIKENPLLKDLGSLKTLVPWPGHDDDPLGR